MVLLAFALVLSAVSFSFTVWSIARMHDFETNYMRVEGTIVDYEIHNGDGTASSTYTLVIRFTYEGKEYRFSDHTGYRARPTDKIGTATEVYVNPKAPERAVRVGTSDGLSVVGVIAFAFAVVPYALGVALYLQTGNSTFRKRLLSIWLPPFLLGAGVFFLFWAGLPHDGLNAVFSRFDGAIGYVVVSALLLSACFIDGLLSVRKAK